MRTILRFPRASENRSKDSILSALGDRYGISLKVADANVGASEEVAELLSFWHPDGCIVNNDTLPVEWFAAYPTVFHHRNLIVENPLHAIVAYDEKAVAEAAALAACELIRQRACDGLKARDVAATFPCGRRMAEIRFRAALGHSILDEIRSVRRARAEMVLSPFRTQLRDEIAALCGYSSWSSVHRLLCNEHNLNN